jgi:arylsulfatase A-like enzyme
MRLQGKDGSVTEIGASRSPVRIRLSNDQVKQTSAGLLYTANDGTTSLMRQGKGKVKFSDNAQIKTSQTGPGSEAERTKRMERIKQFTAERQALLNELNTMRREAKSSAPVHELTIVGDGPHGLAGKPNVLILFADDMRASTIHAMGNDEIITPNLDALVADGVAFPHAYTMGGQAGALCVASRAMLMTGRTLNHLKDNGSVMPPSDKMLGQLLSENGYQTYGIGKWHNDYASYNRGFENGDEVMFGGMVDSQYEVPLNHYHSDGVYDDHCTTPDETRVFSPKVCDHIYHGKHSSEIFADAAIKFLNEKNTSSPFFLYTAFTAPHDPREAPGDVMAKYANVDKISLPPNFMPEHPFDNGHMKGRDEKLLPWPRTPIAVKGEIRDYYAAITYLDAQIGRIIETLKKNGQYDNTIIIFAGDNGLALGQHGLMGKQSVYEHSVGVPMIWAGPGIAKNQKSAAYCYLADIYPTLCDRLKLTAPQNVEGESFAATLQDPTQGARDALYFGFRDLQRAVSDGHYKLIEYNVKGERHTQLFDLKQDPWEMKNLADAPEMQPVKEKLRDLLLKYKDESGDADSKFWVGF